jgi:hypothetical protein
MELVLSSEPRCYRNQQRGSLLLHSTLKTNVTTDLVPTIRSSLSERYSLNVRYYEKLQRLSRK